MSERKICPVCDEVYWQYRVLASYCACGWQKKQYNPPPSGFDYHHEREPDDVERINDEVVYEHTHEY